MPDERQQWDAEPRAALGDTQPSTLTPRAALIAACTEQPRCPCALEGAHEPGGDALLGCNPLQVLRYLLAS